MFESSTAREIIVNVPIHTAYNQWTQFEEFPKYMSAVKDVFQMGDDRVHFRVKIAGHVVEFDAKILEQVHDSRIVWESEDGVEVGGVVQFDPLGSDKTRVSVTMHYAPQGAVERIGDLLGVVSMQVRADLAHFKAFIEKRGVETGAWRSDIHTEPAEDLRRYAEASADAPAERSGPPVMQPLAAPDPQLEPVWTSQQILDAEFDTLDLLEMRQLLLGPGKRWSLGHGIRTSVGVQDAGLPASGAVHAHTARRGAA